MDLDERKLKILNAIIKSYLETGEPVGSRTISKCEDIGLSSATIRNEMADLEEMGYIIQPHTSSGRVPTDLGYRLYVDNMMKNRLDSLDKKEQELAEMKEFLDDKVEKVEKLLEDTAKLLASNTNYATMVTTPVNKSRKLKFIQLSLIEEGKILCVVVTQKNTVKNRIINIEEPITSEDVLKMNLLINTALSGLSFEEINVGLISRITNQAGDNANLVRDIIDIIGLTLTSNDDFRVYTSGANNIFKYPELSETQTASEIISTFEEKKLLTALVENNNADKEEKDDIQVYIGSESNVSSMKDCSIVTATYEIEDGVKGTIGIIGPKRMDYEKVVESLNAVKDQLGMKFKKQDKKNKDGES